MTTPQRNGKDFSDDSGDLNSSFVSDTHDQESQEQQREKKIIQPAAPTIFHLNEQRGLRTQTTAFFDSKPKSKKQLLQASSRANDSVRRVSGDEEQKVFKVRKKVIVPLPQKQGMESSAVIHEGGQQPQIRQSRPTSALQRDAKDQTMGQHLCRDDSTFGTLMERYRSEHHMKTYQNSVQKGKVEQHLSERPSQLADPTKNRTQERLQQAQYKNKSVTFGEDGASGSAFMFKQTSQSFGASPTIVSSSSPKLKLSAQAQHHYNKQSVQLLKVVDMAGEKGNQNQPKVNELIIYDKINQQQKQDSHNTMPPSLTSKLTFCQLTDNSLDEQCYETPSNRGSRTPNQQPKKNVQMSSQSDQLSLSLQPPAIVKASSEINNSRQYYTKKKGSGAKGSRNGSTKTFTSNDAAFNTDAPHSATQIKTAKLGRRDYLRLKLPQDNYIEEVISAMASDEEPLFNSRSASYLAVQSHLREVQGMGVDPEQQSYYDGFLSQPQENNSSWTKMDDGTPKNTLSTQKQAIQQNKKQGQQHHNQMRSIISSNKSEFILSQYSNANASEQKPHMPQYPQSQKLGFNNFRNTHSNERMDEAYQVPQRRFSESATQQQLVQTVLQPPMLAVNDSQMHHQLRPPLGPNSAKKGISVQWGGNHNYGASGFGQNINRTKTVNENLLTQQAKQRRQGGGLGEPLKADGERPYVKLKTQVGRSQHRSWVGQGRCGHNSINQSKAVNDDAASKSSQIVNHLSNQTISKQLKQLSSNRSGTSSELQVGPSQLASSSEKQDLGLNNPLIKVYQVRTMAGHQSPAQHAQLTIPTSQMPQQRISSDLSAKTLTPKAAKKQYPVIGGRSKNKSSKNLSQQSMRTLQESALRPLTMTKGMGVGQGTSMVMLPQSSFISHNYSVSGSYNGGVLHDTVKTIEGMKNNATQRIASNNLSHKNVDVTSSNSVSYFNAAVAAASKNASSLSVRPSNSLLQQPGGNICLTSSTIAQQQQPIMLRVPPGQQQLQKTPDVQGQLQQAKRLYNKMKEKNSKLQARIGYLGKEVADRDKIMQKYILNNVTEAKVKESCVLQSYKSKLAEVERKHESLKKKNVALTTEKAELMTSEELLKGQLQQLSAEKELLHNECVQMSQRIYIEQHERRRQMLANENPQYQIQQAPQLQAEFLVPIQSQPARQSNNSIINIETVRQEQQPASVAPQRPRTAVHNPSRGYQPILPVTVRPNSAARNTRLSPERRQHQQEQRVSPSPARLRELWTPEVLVQINQHKVLEQQQTVDQFNHIKDCATCTVEGAMCDQGCQDYHDFDTRNLDAWRPPIEFMLLNDSQNFEEQRSIYLKVIRDMRVESHRLGLMLLQEMHERRQERLSQFESISRFRHVQEQIQCETEDLQQEEADETNEEMDFQSQEDTRELKALKTTYYLGQLKQQIIEQEEIIREFKREIQRLYAPKVKIILQLRTLQDEAAWRATSKDPRANVERAKACLRDVFHLSDKVFDDSFFKTFLRNFEPVFSSETAKMTQKVIDALRKAQQRCIKKLGVGERDVVSAGEKLSSVHRVVSIQDLESNDPKLLQFARYLAHQTLKSEENLSIEIVSGGSDQSGLATSFQLSDCMKHMATQYSTLESDRIDETHTNSLMSKLYDSKALDVFFSTMKATKPMLIDCVTFRNMMSKFSESIEEDRAADQLLNSLKVRTLCTHMVDLGELHRILTMESPSAHDDQFHQLAAELNNGPVGRKPQE